MIEWEGSRVGIFRKKSESAPVIPSTGDADDDQLLWRIAQQSDLAVGRHWVHYVYFANEGAARAAAAQIIASGWDVQRVDQSADGGPEWVVIAEQHGVVTSPEAVRNARMFFESVAAAHSGGDYDGWEASL
jgi:hypothetical protein